MEIDFKSAFLVQWSLAYVCVCVWTPVPVSGCFTSLGVCLYVRVQRVGSFSPSWTPSVTGQIGYDRDL